MDIKTKISVLANAWKLIGGSAEEYSYAWWDIQRELIKIERGAVEKAEQQAFMDELRERL